MTPKHPIHCTLGGGILEKDDDDPALFPGATRWRCPNCHFVWIQNIDTQGNTVMSILVYRSANEEGAANFFYQMDVFEALRNNIAQRIRNGQLKDFTK